MRERELSSSAHMYDVVFYVVTVAMYDHTFFIVAAMQCAVPVEVKFLLPHVISWRGFLVKRENEIKLRHNRSSSSA